MKQLKIYLAFLIIAIPLVLNAQQEPMYGQYIFNNSVINPAQAGGGNANQWGVLARHQWIGIDGAPKTETAFANFRLPGQLGLAIGIYQDRLGPEINLQFQADLAYHARLSENWYLAGGLRIIGSHLKVNMSRVPHIDPDNPYFHEDLSSGLLLNAGVGLLAYTESSFFGIAIPKAFRNQLGINEPGIIDFRKKEVRHLFAYAGSNIAISDEMTFIPSALFKYSENAPVQLDLNAVISFQNVLDFGPLLRSNVIEINNWFDAIGFLIGIQFLDNWYLGYMYEYPLTDLQHAAGPLRQTHELSLRFIWDTKHHRRIGSPRYFL